ncbi:sulfur globule protein CV3-like [Episyrphus balteatus]|uniref:sulfur globule protein CV3-like n=1 Tax=Episyrphus balteatus TaxID=286459 RepID=UPI0024869A0D|nr:sulfur globule protein CV3-like [Episyrphus balteatus]
MLVDFIVNHKLNMKLIVALVAFSAAVCLATANPIFGYPYGSLNYGGSPYYGSSYYGSPYIGSPYVNSPYYGGSPYLGSPYLNSPYVGVGPQNVIAPATGVIGTTNQAATSASATSSATSSSSNSAGNTLGVGNAGLSPYPYGNIFGYGGYI